MFGEGLGKKYHQRFDKLFGFCGGEERNNLEWDSAALQALKWDSERIGKKVDLQHKEKGGFFLERSERDPKRGMMLGVVTARIRNPKQLEITTQNLLMSQDLS